MNMIGKLPPKLLQKYVFSRIGVRDLDVLVGPSIGEDSAVIKFGDKYLVLHVDPITGAVESIGWLSVHISCNDISVSGARPRWLLPVLYIPEDSDENFIDMLTKQIDEAAKEIGAMIIGGHTEFTPGLKRPMISMTAVGIVDREKLVRTGGANIGDKVLMTKYAGLEGTTILASDFYRELIKAGIDEDMIKSGKKLIKNISVVEEALLLAENKYASSMHDPTEGGLIGGLTEIAYASKKTIEVWEDKIPVLDITMEFSKALDIDYLKLISSGVLIATVPDEYLDDAVSILRNKNIEVSVIGVVKEYTGDLLILNRKDGGSENYRDVYVLDELMRLWSELR